MFRLLRYYSVASGLALLVVVVVLVAIYRQASLASIVETVESENVAMSQALANAIWPKFSDYVTVGAPEDGDALRARPETLEIHAAAKSLVAGLSVVKIKIYRLNGLSIYSSDPSQIGKIQSYNKASIASARRGVPASEFRFRPEFNGINGPLSDRHIVGSYIPVRGKSGKIEAIFELYSDATNRVEVVSSDVKWLSIGLVWAFGLLYGVLFIIVRRADKIIKSQYADLRHEIGNRLSAQQRLQRALEEAEHANKSKSDFLAHMSHELRTPLNSILGFSETMDQEVFGKLGDKKYVEYAKDIHRSGSHLLQLINEVLDVSKVEAGAMEMNESNVDLNDTMKECAALMKDEAKKVGIKLNLSVPKYLPEFRGDDLRLKQIFLNLLSNAIKFTPTGGEITLEAGLEESGSLKIAVADTGIGIEAEDLQRILLPFEQVEDHMNRKTPGTGLGLALTKALTELHGGKLSLESEFGVGTKVTLRFPPERAIITQPELPLIHP
ncbi:MAG: HAMP domain-containing histidine kinase [Rhodospirillales bacterium]|nr:HAMP domain-containing histidine kinase [Rhodospirillales bacterium]